MRPQDIALASSRRCPSSRSRGYQHESSLHRGPTIDLDRLLWRIDALAAIGDTGDGGACRLALTDDDRVGRDLVVAWMDELDMRVEVDTIGNIRGTWPADGTGSRR